MPGQQLKGRERKKRETKVWKMETSVKDSSEGILCVFVSFIASVVSSRRKASNNNSRFIVKS